MILNPEPARLPSGVAARSSGSPGFGVCGNQSSQRNQPGSFGPRLGGDSPTSAAVDSNTTMFQARNWWEAREYRVSQQLQSIVGLV